MSKKNWKLTLLEGASSYFNYKKTKAETNLSNYIESPAGIGEHGDIVEECIKLIEAIEHAKGCIEIVDEIKQKE